MKYISHRAAAMLGIDGLPYRAVDTGNAKVQGAWFGGTFMIRRTDDGASEWRLPLDRAKSRVLVDLVGTPMPRL